MSVSNTPGDGAPDPLVGELLAGRYRILSRLGEGAMGAVYLGEHVRMGRRDAIKVLRQDIGHDPESMSRFVRGARNVSLIRHPNVCTIYDFSDTAEGTQFLAMEYIEGETLKDVLDREGRLALDRALAISVQIADALQAAHDVGVIHRDLKPGNVMITRRPDGSEVVKVVDFDIAKGPQEQEGEEVTRLGFVVGTPEYMSPEQLMGERLDGRSDLYSLAVVLFRMLTSALPFRSTATQDMMIERLTAAPVPLEEALPNAALPPQLGAVIARALSRRREDRHDSAADFARDLRAACAEATPVQSVSPVPPPVPGRDGMVPETAISPVSHVPTSAAVPQGRGRLIAAGAAVVVVLAVGAIALASPFGRADQQANERAETTQSGPEAGRPGSAGTEQASQGSTGADPQPEGAQGPEAGPAGPTGGGRVGEQSGGTPGDQGRAGVPPAVPPASLLPGSHADVLDRQMMALSAAPTGARLRAINDTATLLWRASATRDDSAGAALLLAQAALMADRPEDCRRWARQALQLGVTAAGMVLEGCG